MTIVAGYLDPAGKVWMAADTLSSADAFVFPERTRKLFRTRDWLIGMSGSDRHHEFVPRAAGFENVEEIRDRLMNHARTIGSDGVQEKGEPAGYHVSLLAARAGELYAISGDGCIWRPAWGFAAVGSGQDYAYGAAHALLCGRDPSLFVTGEDVVRKAVEAACAFRGDCGGEIDIETVG